MCLPNLRLSRVQPRCKLQEKLNCVTRPLEAKINHNYFTLLITTWILQLFTYVHKTISVTTVRSMQCTMIVPNMQNLKLMVNRVNELKRQCFYTEHLLHKFVLPGFPRRSVKRSYISLYHQIIAWSCSCKRQSERYLFASVFAYFVIFTRPQSSTLVANSFHDPSMTRFQTIFHCRCSFDVEAASLRACMKQQFISSVSVLLRECKK